MLNSLLHLLHVDLPLKDKVFFGLSMRQPKKLARDAPIIAIKTITKLSSGIMCAPKKDIGNNSSID